MRPKEHDLVRSECEQGVAEPQELDTMQRVVDELKQTLEELEIRLDINESQDIGLPSGDDTDMRRRINNEIDEIEAAMMQYGS